MKDINSASSRTYDSVRVTQSPRLLVILFTLLCSLLIMAVNPVKGLEVDPEKSYVLVKAFNTQRRGLIEYLIFQNTDSDERFRVRTRGQLAQEVIAGTYFLSNIKTKDSYTGTVEPLEISSPTDKVGTIEIKKGAVTYIGDWGASVDLGVEPRIFDWGVNYELDTIKTFGRKYPELKEHNLNIANNLGDVYQVNWSDVGK